MKTISFYMTAVFVLFTFHGITQVKVYEKIFGDKPTDDLNKDLSIQVYGSFGEYLANGRIGFGDYPIYPDVFVGEYGEDIDSDKLELYGEDGMFFTWGRGYGYNNIIGNIIDIPYIIEDGFYFHTDVYAKGIILSSDESFKENIKPLKNSLSILKQIHGVNYNLKAERFSKINLTDSENLTEKEQRDIESYNNTVSKMQEDKKERLGFIAQEVQSIFPDLVSEDEEGYLYIDYIGIIPLLVEAIKEQQKQITQLQSFYK